MCGDTEKCGFAATGDEINIIPTVMKRVKLKAIIRVCKIIKQSLELFFLITLMLCDSIHMI